MVAISVPDVWWLHSPPTGNAAGELRRGWQFVKDDCSEYKSLVCARNYSITNFWLLQQPSGDLNAKDWDSFIHSKLLDSKIFKATKVFRGHSCHCRDKRNWFWDHWVICLILQKKYLGWQSILWGLCHWFYYLFSWLVRQYLYILNDYCFIRPDHVINYDFQSKSAVVLGHED